MSKNNKKTKKVLNVPRIIVFLLLIYIIISFGLFIYKEKVHHYEINGVSYYKEIDIIRMLNLQDYPSFISLNLNNLKKTLEGDSLISKAKVSYGWNFTIKIDIEENSPVFVIKSSNNVVLKDGNQIPYEESFGALPMLLNNTPTESLVLLAENLSKIDRGVLGLISEITYTPYNSTNTILDNNRFLLSMSDSNQVYINAKNCSWLNEYLDVIATNRITEPGTFFFDGNLGKMIYKKAKGEEKVVEQSTVVEQPTEGANNG
ncbi:MAG: FtsQ-type POTRA domain-containing protein [Bacilli bacterium]|nr:FtsQ-type POTRA domain-containing protein [Bacilli bacterium]